MTQNGERRAQRKPPVGSDAADNRSAHCSPVGVLGLGLLGGAIAQRLVALGYQVFGFDIDTRRRTLLSAGGVTIVPHATDLFSHCEQIILSLPTSEVVQRVVKESWNGLRAGQYLIDTTTCNPDFSASLTESLTTREVNYLDAAVAGSSSQVRSGNIVLLVGGPHDVFAACQPLLNRLAKQVHLVGPSGSGAKLKLVHNLVLGLNRAVLAEGLAFARSLGLDPHHALEILRGSAAYSGVMDQKGERMLASHFEPEARLSQHLKDVRLMLEAGCVSGIRLPLCETHLKLLEASEAAGWGALDNSAIIRAFDHGWPGNITAGNIVTGSMAVDNIAVDIGAANPQP
jgi:3-hydroxyisobutyrate dehydrogenase-like beta-hydroxyacid dehydrogenase